MRGWADFGRREANSKGVAQGSPWRWSAPLVRAGWRGRGARVHQALLCLAARACEIHRSIARPTDRSDPGAPTGPVARRWGDRQCGRSRPAARRSGAGAAPSRADTRDNRRRPYRPTRTSPSAPPLSLRSGAKRGSAAVGPSWGGALGDGGVERAAGLGRRALGHPVHPAPGTPLPPEVTPRLPPRLSPPPPCVLHLAAPCSFVQNA